MLTSEQVKNTLTVDQIIQIMCELGSEEPYYDAQGHPMFTTICHGGDSHKLYYYDETKLFHCYTHCGSLDLFQIVQNVKQIDDFYEAFKYVVKFFNLQDDNSGASVKLTSDWDIFQRMDDLTSKRTELSERIVNENILDLYPIACPTEWLSENISEEAMIDFGIRVDTAGYKIIIPHRNINGDLIGIRGRNFYPFDLDKAKYAPIYIEHNLYNFPTGKHLFGLYRNKDAISKLKKAVIFEGEKSVLQMASYYPPGQCVGVATCGSNITQDQIDLLLNLGVEEVILAYDRDYESHKGEPETKDYEQKLYKIVQPLLTYFKVYIIMDYDHLTGYKDSPSDCGKEIFEKLLQNKKYIPPIMDSKIRR